MRCGIGNIGDGDAIVTINRHPFPQLSQVLHQVVGKRVVVIDHQEHMIVILLYPSVNIRILPAYLGSDESDIYVL
jgi:helix-turn-helix protein